MDEVEGEEGVVVLGNEVLFENIGRELLGLLKEEEKTTGVTGTRVTQILSSLLRVGDTKKNEIQALAQLFHDHSLLLNEEPDFDQNITYTLPAFASNPLTSNSFLSLQLDKAPLKRNEEDFNKHCDLLKMAWNYEREKLIKAVITQQEEFELSKQGFKTDTPKKKKKKTWETIVPQEVREQLSKTECERQEVIFEMIKTEASYIKELQLLQKLMQEIKKNCPINEKQLFIQKVFGNIEAILDFSLVLSNSFKKRQTLDPIIKEIGDIFLQHINAMITPYLIYYENRMISRDTLEKELGSNKKLKEICNLEQKESRGKKLDLESLLASPITRFSHYSVFLREIQKCTDPDSPDHQNIEIAIQRFDDAAAEIDKATGIANNRYRINELYESYSKQSDKGVVGKKLAQLELKDSKRELLKAGVMDGKNDGSYAWTVVKLVLFDNAVLITTPMDKILPWQYAPIPLLLLDIMDEDTKVEIEPKTSKFQSFRTKSKSSKDQKEKDKDGDEIGDNEGQNEDTQTQAITRQPSFSIKSSLKKKRISTDDSQLKQRRNSLDGTSSPASNSKQSKVFVLQHLGKCFFTFKPSTVLEKEAWMKALRDAQLQAQLNHRIFEENMVIGRCVEKMNCAVSFVDTESGKRVYLMGNNSGIFVARNTEGSSFSLFRVISIENVMQLEIRLDYGVIFAIAGSSSSLYIYPMKILSLTKTSDNESFGSIVDGSKRTILFSVDAYLGRNSIWTIRTKAVGYQCSVFELKRTKKNVVETQPMKSFVLGMKDRPTSIRMDLLPGILTICSEYGIYNVDIESGKSSNFLHSDNKYSSPKPRTPLALFRINLDVLVCFQECAFFVKCYDGKMFSQEPIVFTGRPTSFALASPYLLGFCDRFVEVRNIFNGELKQVIILNELQHLSTNSDKDPTAPILCQKSSDLYRSSSSSIVVLNPKKIPE